MTVEKIHSSIYFHPSINPKNTRLLEQLNTVLDPQEVIVFFRPSSYEGNPNQKKITELGGAITGSISQVVLGPKVKIKKILIPFCFMPQDNFLTFSLSVPSNKAFTNLSDLFGEETQKHQKAYLLLNLVENEKIETSERLSAEQVKILIERINEDGLLNASTVRKAIFPTKFESMKKLSFDSVLTIKAIEEANVYLLKTDNQAALIGHESLIMLQKCQIVFQNNVEQKIQPSQVAMSASSSFFEPKKTGKKRKHGEQDFGEDEKDNPEKFQKTDEKSEALSSNVVQAVVNNERVLESTSATTVSHAL